MANYLDNIEIICEESEDSNSIFPLVKNCDIFIVKYDRDIQYEDKKIIEKKKIEGEILFALVNKIEKFKNNHFDFILDKVWYRLHLETVNFEKIKPYSKDDEINDATLDGTD